MDQSSSGVDWESLIADLLDDLSNVQGDLLTTLTAKRDAMAAGAMEQLEPLQQQEQDLSRRLEACHQRRAKLLQAAAAQGLPSASISQLAGVAAEDKQLGQQMEQVAASTRLLRHHSLTNWVLAQRSLLHLSQLLEILATGGQTKPTYSKEESPLVRGNLVDHAA